MIVVKKERLRLDKLIGKIKIALISDLHLKDEKSKKRLNIAIKKINKKRVNIIFLLGDYFFDNDINLHDINVLSRLKARNGIFAILGNHDYGMEYRSSKRDKKIANKIIKRLKKLNINVLINESYLINLGKDKLNILGIDDYWSKYNINKTFSKVNKSYPIILLSHNPDIVLKLKKNHHTDIIISGHTHGHAIRLPIIGPITSLMNTELGRKYDKGFKRYDKKLMYITSGLGEQKWVPRLLNPPEIVIFKVKRRSRFSKYIRKVRNKIIHKKYK